MGNHFVNVRIPLSHYDTNNIQLNDIFKREFVKPKSSALKILSYAICSSFKKNG